MFLMDFYDISEEGKGETEFRNPCECEALVQFQSNTLAILEDLTERHILLAPQTQDRSVNKMYNLHLAGFSF